MKPLLSHSVRGNCVTSSMCSLVCLSENVTKCVEIQDIHMHIPSSIRGQLHFHQFPTDRGHGSIYGKCQESRADHGVWGGNVKKVSDLRMRQESLSGL